MTKPIGCSADKCRKRGFYSCVTCDAHICRKHRIKKYGHYWCRECYGGTEEGGS